MMQINAIRAKKQTLTNQSPINDRTIDKKNQNDLSEDRFIDNNKRDLKTALQNIKLKQKIGNMIDKTAGRRYQKLKDEKFKMLNDLSIVISEDSSSKQSSGDSSEKKEDSFIERLNKIFPPFNPSSRIKLVWDLSQMIQSICIIFIVPIHLIFQIDLMQLVPSLLVYSIIPLSLIIEIFVNLNTACFLKGVLISNRKVILMQYFNTDFKYDIIANIPLFVYCLSYHKTDPTQPYEIYRFIILTCFCKFHQFNKVFKRVEEEFPLSPLTSNIISLVKLLFSIILNLHISALTWLTIGFIQTKNGSDGTWMDAAGISNSDWYVQYIYSYYFSTVTMITVGYGDISPKTVAERLLCIANMMIACGQFAYSVNSIGNIFEQFFKLDNEIKANMFIINNYMTNKTISKDLQYQVREYLEYYWKEEKSNNTDSEIKILDQLSHKLKDTLLMEANKIALRESPIFSNNFSDIIVQKILPLIKEVRCTPEEIIYLKGDQDDQSIYFIEKGQVEAFTYQKTPFNKKMKTINSLYTIGPGKFFGEISFFTGEGRDINIRSLEFTTLLKIKRNDFVNLLKDSPDDYEIYCMLRDQLFYSKEKNSVMSKCQCCQQYDHQLYLCPLIHFVPSKFSIIRQFSTGRDNQRQSYQRKRSEKKDKTLEKNEYCQGRMEDFVNDNMEDIRAYFRKYFIEMGKTDSDESLTSSDYDYDDDDDEDDEGTQFTSNNNHNEDKNKDISEQEIEIAKIFEQRPNRRKISKKLTNHMKNQNTEKNQSLQEPLNNEQKLILSMDESDDSSENDKQEENIRPSISFSMLNNIEENTSKNNNINQIQIKVDKPRCFSNLEIEENVQIKQEDQSKVQTAADHLKNALQNPYLKQQTQKNSKRSVNAQQGNPNDQRRFSQKRNCSSIWSLYKKIQNQDGQKKEPSLSDLQKDTNILATLLQVMKNKVQYANKPANNRKQILPNNLHPSVFSAKDQFTANKTMQFNQIQQILDGDKKNEMNNQQYYNQMLFQNQHINQEPIDDIMRNYKFYYPKHNISNIIENVIEKKRQKREEEKKKMEEDFQQKFKDNVMIQKRVRSNQVRILQLANKSKKTSKQISKEENFGVEKPLKKLSLNNLQEESSSSSSSSSCISQDDKQQDLSQLPDKQTTQNLTLQQTPNKQTLDKEEFLNETKTNNISLNKSQDDNIEREGSIQQVQQTNDLNFNISFSAFNNYKNQSITDFHEKNCIKDGLEQNNSFHLNQSTNRQNLDNSNTNFNTERDQKSYTFNFKQNKQNHF